jgi:hypothetical protein
MAKAQSTNSTGNASAHRQAAQRVHGQERDVPTHVAKKNAAVSEDTR